jgi:hypothetical protein
MQTAFKANKGDWQATYILNEFDAMEDDWLAALNKLMYELVQFAKGLWFTQDDKDQFGINFDLIRVMEEHRHEIEEDTYPIKVQRL